MKYLSILLLLLSFTACQNSSCDNAEAPECKQFSPPDASSNQVVCQMYVKGYYYDKKTNKCTYYEGSACNQPPFKKVSECVSCECP